MTSPFIKNDRESISRNMILFGPWNRGDGTRAFPVCDLCGNAVARTLLLSSPRGPLFEICEVCLALASEKIARRPT